MHMVRRTARPKRSKSVGCRSLAWDLVAAGVNCRATGVVRTPPALSIRVKLLRGRDDGPIIGDAMTDTAARSPVLLIVDPDLKARNAIQTALERRFGQDYQVVSVASAEAAHETLTGLASDHEDVALVAAELHLDG